MTPTDINGWLGVCLVAGVPIWAGLAANSIKNRYRCARGQWLEGDYVRCPECGRRAQLEHWYGAEDCSLLSTECCTATVVAELEVNGALTYPYGMNLWKVKTTRKTTR
jgi:hypothetical protein